MGTHIFSYQIIPETQHLQIEWTKSREIDKIKKNIFFTLEFCMNGLKSEESIMFL